MKKHTLALLLLLTTFSVAHAQDNSMGMTRERQANPAIEAKRAEVQAAREALTATREEHKAEAEARKAETKEFNAELKDKVKTGDMSKEEAKAELTAKKEENKAAAVSNREEREAKRDDMVAKRQELIDTRIAQVREKNPAAADILENYYGQIMDMIVVLQAKRDELITAVQNGDMDATEAKTELQALVETNKSTIKSLMEEMKAALSALKNTNAES